MGASAQQPAAAPMAALADGRLARGLYLLHRGLSRLSGGRVSLPIYLFCAQPIAAGAVAGLRQQSDVVVRKVAADDPLVEAFPRSPAIVRQRYANGAICYAVTVKNEFAGHIWLNRLHYDEDEVRCRYCLPDSQSVWDFDVYVAPRFRVGRTMARLWDATAADLHAGGVRWSFSRISLYNPGSVRSHERLGAVHLATGVFLKMGALEVALFSRRPWPHVSVKGRPEFQMPPPPRSAVPAA